MEIWRYTTNIFHITKWVIMYTIYNIIYKGCYISHSVQSIVKILKKRTLTNVRGQLNKTRPISVVLQRYTSRIWQNFNRNLKKGRKRKMSTCRLYIRDHLTFFNSRAFLKRSTEVDQYASLTSNGFLIV